MTICIRNIRFYRHYKHEHKYEALHAVTYSFSKLFLGQEAPHDTMNISGIKHNTKGRCQKHPKGGGVPRFYGGMVHFHDFWYF